MHASDHFRQMVARAVRGVLISVVVAVWLVVARVVREGDGRVRNAAHHVRLAVESKPERAILPLQPGSGRVGSARGHGALACLGGRAVV